MKIKLYQLKIDESAVISAFEKGQQPYRQKLLSMGLTRGTSITLNKLAPFGDPVEISVRGFHLSLRKHEADILILEREDVEKAGSADTADTADKEQDL